MATKKEDKDDNFKGKITRILGDRNDFNYTSAPINKTNSFCAIKGSVYYLFAFFFTFSFVIISCSCVCVSLLHRFPSEVHGLAIDSAFVSMYDAALEIADKKVHLPTIFIKGMLEYVRR